MTKRIATALASILFFSSQANAAVKTKSVEYEHAGVPLVGHLAWDDSVEGKRPGVLVVHEWWGLNDYARGRAERLAKMGYVAFALDMYGKGKVTEHPREAGEWATQVRSNVDSWRERAKAGLEILRGAELVDPDRIAAIGYCFGGATVLQLAYSGADVKGVVTFHGALPLPEDVAEGRIKPSILICHGAEDGFVPEEQAQKLREMLGKLGADWTMIYYAGARHSFTNPGADKRGMEGLKYNKKADQRSWRHMQVFFDEIFAQ
jgi:dienelactone hydrolase